jgi:hypothetical protein
MDPRQVETKAEWNKALQGLFARAGLSYHVLAEKTGLSASTLQQMVTGQSFPRASTVRMFVKACGVSDAQPWVDARTRVAVASARRERPRTPASRQVRVGAVPRTADGFQDRAVSQRLMEATGEKGTVVLAGTGGVGKTQLAAAYARQAWRDGTGMLVWVNAASRDAIVAAYADAALALQLPGADRENPEHSAQAFLSWAETVTDRWWLVVLDDVQHPADLNGLWPPAAESAAGGQVLVTTRLREAAVAGTGRRAVQVTTFAPAEARAYLRGQLGGIEPDDQLDRLAAGLGFLPLALAQASAYISNADIGIGRYLDLLGIRLLREVVPEPGNLTNDHQRIVSATWDLSVEQASRAKPVGLAQPVLELASVLDSAGIPQQVLSSPPAIASLTAVLSVGIEDEAQEPVDAAAVDEVLRVLHRYSLIDHDRTARYREVRVHQLIQRATRENLGSGPCAVPEILASAAAAALEEDWPQFEHDEFVQVLRANVTALQHAAGQALWASGRYEVLFLSASSLGRTGQATAARDAYVAIRDSAQRHLGPEHPDTIMARSHIAHWMGEAGDAAGAAAAYEEVFAQQVRVLGPDHSDTMMARGNAARWRGEAGDVAGAATAYGDVLADLIRVLGPDHPDTMMTRHNLADLRGRAGNAAGAAAAFEELLADRLRMLHPDDHDTLKVRSNLAKWRGEAGNPAGAVAAYREVLTDMLRVLGPDHPDTMIVRSNLARQLGEAGNPAGAVAAYREVLTDMLRVLGPDHPDTMSTRGNVATWQGQAGDPAGAAALFKELLNDRLRVLGRDHPDTLLTRGNLAFMRGSAGDAAVAAAEYEDLLADMVRVLGPGHPDTLGARGNLAHWQGRAGDPARAAAAYTEMLGEFQQMFGAKHPLTLAVRESLGYWKSAVG